MDVARGEFEALMVRLRAGDEEASRDVFLRYVARLTSLARSRLSARIRRKVDPEDIVQSVYNSFFLRHADGQFLLQGWDGLWSILAVMTIRRCGRWANYFHAGIRNVDAEASAGPLAEGVTPPWEALADDPTPAEAAILSELVERLLTSFEPRHRRIVSLSLQGCSVAEVAAEVDRSERTVQRVLEHVRAKLEEMKREDEGRP